MQLSPADFFQVCIPLILNLEITYSNVKFSVYFESKIENTSFAPKKKKKKFLPNYCLEELDQ